MKQIHETVLMKRYFSYYRVKIPTFIVVAFSISKINPVLIMFFFLLEGLREIGQFEDSQG